MLLWFQGFMVAGFRAQGFTVLLGLKGLGFLLALLA